MPAASAVRRRVLVTGASSGIGAALARVFAAHGFDVVLTARRADRLEALASELRHRWSVSTEVIPADLEDPATPQRLFERTHDAGLTIDALANNAGYGLSGRYLSRRWSEHATMLQLMVMAVAELTYLFVGPMVDRGYGRIVNVASLAGLVPASAGHTLYGATKAFMIKFSESLAHEVEPQGVHVAAVCPGFTRTEFHDIAGTRNLVQRLPRWMWLDAEFVAQAGFDAVMAGRPRLVPGRVNRTIATITRHLPTAAMVWAVKRVARNYRRS